MKKGNTLIILGIVFVCVVTAIVIVYGVLSITLSSHFENNEEQFDALINEGFISLNDVAFQLESSAFIGSIRLYKGQANIDVDENKLKIDIENKDVKYSNIFYLNDSILTVNLFNDEKLDDITISILEEIYNINYDNKEVIRKYLVETNSERYNLENAGIEKRSDCIIMNISKKIEVIDFSSEYLTVEDIEEYKVKLKRESLTTISNNNISMIKSGYDGKIVLSIAEYDEITSSTYKSLVNALAVIYDYDGFYKEFIKVNPTSRLVNTNKENYKIEIDPEKENYESSTFGERPMVRITIYG